MGILGQTTKVSQLLRYMLMGGGKDGTHGLTRGCPDFLNL
jgi:hypothetical protein